MIKLNKKTYNKLWNCKKKKKDQNTKLDSISQT